MMSNFFSMLLDLIAPRKCFGCGRRLSLQEEAICAGCMITFTRMRFHLNAYDNPLKQLIEEKVHIEKAAAWIRYSVGSNAARAVHALKYCNHPEAGVIYGRIMAREIKPSGFFNDIDILIPVPLARKRQKQRGYNQSFMIAKGIGEITGLPVVDGAIERTKFSVSQTRLTHLERIDNVKGLFCLVDDTKLRGKHVLVIDDVITTGSTIVSCIMSLSDIEDIKISVLSMAFTVS